MPPTKLALADELAAIRAEIARLKRREDALASIQHNFPKVPVFRRRWPMRQAGASTAAAALTTAPA
jgi:hypothetical protein